MCHIKHATDDHGCIATEMFGSIGEVGCMVWICMYV